MDIIINPRRAKHVRVTVVVLCVCMYVCLFHPNLKNNSPTRQNQGTNV